MSITTRVAALAAQALAVAGAASPWLARVPGVNIAFRALTDPHRPTALTAVPGAGWIVIGAAAAGVLAALAGSRILLAVAATAQLLTIADFVVLESVRRSPGNYDAVDVADGCWLVLIAALAGLLAAVMTRPRLQQRREAVQ